MTNRITAVFILLLVPPFVVDLSIMGRTISRGISAFYSNTGYYR